MASGANARKRADADDQAPERAFRAYLKARPRLRRGAAAVWLALLVVGLAAGLSRVFDDAATAHDMATADRARVAAQFQALITSQISKATSLATAVAGFGVGDATGPINHTAPAAERIRFNNETHWQAFAENLVDAVPGIAAFEVQPSGIVAHVYPPNPSFVGFDLLTFNSTAKEYASFIAGGRPVIVGPAELLEGGIGLVTRFPAYVGRPKSLATFWGAGACVFQVSALLEGMLLAQRVRAAGYKLLAYTNNDVNNPDRMARTNDIYVTEPGLTRAAMCGSEGQRAKIQIDSHDAANELFICVGPAGGMPSSAPSASAVTAVVAGTLGAASAALVLLLAAVFAAFELRHSAVPHRSRETKMVSCALVAVKELGWWQEHQDAVALAADLQRFEAAVGKLAAAHGCHLSGRISDGCCVVVGRSPAAMHRFGSACRRELATSLGVLALQLGGEAGESESAATRPTSRGRRSHLGRSAATDPRLERRSSAHRSLGAGTSRTSRPGGDACRTFAIACAVHFGALAASYEAEQDQFRFGGAAMAGAAAAVDATRSGELSFTDAFMGLLLEDDAGAEAPTAAVLRPLGDETVHVVECDDAEAAAAVAGGGKGKGSRRRKGRGEDSSVLTAVSAVSGAVLVKRVALVALEMVLPPDAHEAQAAAKKFPETLGRLAAATAAARGDVVSVSGTRVTVAFNAMHAAAAPATKALTAVDALRTAAGEGRWIAAATIGTASVAATASGTVMCVGACVGRVQALADRVAAAVAEEPGDAGVLTMLTIVDAPMAEESRQSHELECVGTLGHAAHGGAAGTDGFPSMAAQSTSASFSTSATVTPRTPQLATGGAAGAATSLSISAAAGAGRSRVKLLYAVHGPWNDDEDACAEDDGEWLYRLQSREARSPFTVLNRACEAFAEGRDGDAAEAAAAVLETPEHGATRIVASPFGLSMLRHIHSAGFIAIPTNTVS